MENRKKCVETAIVLIGKYFIGYQRIMDKESLRNNKQILSVYFFSLLQFLFYS